MRRTGRQSGSDNGDVRPHSSEELRVTGEGDDVVWEVPTAMRTRYLSHDYFRYIGKFPPQIARQFLQAYSRPGDTVLDPMCGGGTVLIEGRLAGRRCLGIDVNPVAVLISSVATRALPQEELEAEVAGFLAGLEEALGPQQTLPFGGETRKPPGVVALPDMHGDEKYFDKATLHGMAVYFALLKGIPSREIHDFLLLALLSILRTISHANVKKMNLELDFEKRTRKPLLAALRAKLAKMVTVNRKLQGRFLCPVPEIRQGEAGDTQLPDEHLDLIVVHPPYMTNTAFCEVTQLQLALLGIAHTAVWRKELRNRGSFLREPDGVRKYLVDWNRILIEMYRVLKQGGHGALVVGDGQVDYTRIPVGAITAEFASDIGFRIVMRGQHRLNNNTGKTLSRKMRDQHLLVLRK